MEKRSSSGTLPTIKTKYKAKLERKRAEEDARLLANRIALLKQEEMKSIKHIGSTTKKAMQIYFNKIQLEKRAKILEEAKNKQKLNMKKTLEIKAQMEDEKFEKLKLYKESKEKRIEEIKKYKILLEKNVKYIKARHIQDNIQKRKAVQENLNLGKEKILNYQSSKIESIKSENINGVKDEEVTTKQILLEIDKMEKLEMELLSRLQTTQPIQEKAMEQLQNALNLKPNKFESMYDVDEKEAIKIIETKEIDISAVKDKKNNFTNRNISNENLSQAFQYTIGIQKPESNMISTTSLVNKDDSNNGQIQIEERGEIINKDFKSITDSEISFENSENNDKSQTDSKKLQS